jgi:hypothetical protein
MINNVSGTVEEAAQIIGAMSPEKRSDFCNEMFKYDSGNPVPRTEGSASGATVTAA